MSNIKGKVIAITGASSGIGEAAARLLAERGAKVVVGARRTDRLEKLVAEIKAKGGEAAFRAVDVAERADVQAFADFAKSQFGKVDVLVNNAGVMPLSPMAALKVDEWDKMIDEYPRGSARYRGGTSRHEGAGQRPDHQCRFDRRPRGRSDRRGLLRYQIRRLGNLRRSASGESRRSRDDHLSRRGRD